MYFHICFNCCWRRGVYLSNIYNSGITRSSSCYDVGIYQPPVAIWAMMMVMMMMTEVEVSVFFCTFAFVFFWICIYVFLNWYLSVSEFVCMSMYLCVSEFECSCIRDCFLLNQSDLRVSELVFIVFVYLYLCVCAFVFAGLLSPQSVWFHGQEKTAAADKGHRFYPPLHVYFHIFKYIDLYPYICLYILICILILVYLQKPSFLSEINKNFVFTIT